MSDCGSEAFFFGDEIRRAIHERQVLRDELRSLLARSAANRKAANESVEKWQQMWDGLYARSRDALRLVQSKTESRAQVLETLRADNEDLTRELGRRTEEIRVRRREALADTERFEDAARGYALALEAAARSHEDPESGADGDGPSPVDYGLDTSDLRRLREEFRQAMDRAQIRLARLQ